MTETPKLYDKSNSILELRQHHGHGVALDRIRALAQTLPPVPDSDDYRQSILRRACADLLEASTAEGDTGFKLKDFVVEEIARLPDDDLSRYLFYRYRYDVLPRVHEVDNFPPCLQIEPTSVCNYRCVFCYQTDTDFSKKQSSHMGMMTLDLFKKVVDEAEGQCEAVTLASRGEPLICPEIEGMLAYLHGKFLGVKINTNASLLNERRCHAILQADINTLVFSADAASEPLYSKLRVNGKLDTVLANIKRFNQIKEQHYPDSQLITRVSGVRYSEQQDLDEMDGLWGELVDQVAFVDYNPWENTYILPPNDVTLPCSDLWRRTFVWFDGIVNPCDVDYRSTLGVGNANTDSIGDLWRGEGYTRLREAHLSRRRGTVSPCRSCTVV